MKQGFTLLEVIIAIAVLLLGLAAVFHLNTLTRNTSVGAEELAMVQLACQTKMNEILATQNVPGTTTAKIPDVSVTENSDWEMLIATSPLPNRNLVEVRITAYKRGSTPNESDRRYELVRWMWKDADQNTVPTIRGFNYTQQRQ